MFLAPNEQRTKACLEKRAWQTRHASDCLCRSDLSKDCRARLSESFIPRSGSATGLLMKGRALMRIAIPMNGDRLDPHFGHCEKFALIDVAPGSKVVTSSQEIAAPEH